MEPRKYRFCTGCGKYIAIKNDGFLYRHGYKRFIKNYWAGGTSGNMAEYGIICFGVLTQPPQNKK